MENLFVFLLIVGCVSGHGSYSKYESTTYTHCSNNTDILIVADSSGSIDADDFRSIQEFMIHLSEEMNGDGVNLGMLLYSTCVKIVRPISPVADIEDVHKCINDMKQLRGMTNLYKGLTTAKEMIERSNDAYPHRKDNSKIVIVVSDGAPNRDCGLVDDAVDDLMSMPGMTIVSVGVGQAGMPSTPGYNVMESISSTNEVISVHGYDTLSEETIDEICKDITIVVGNPCPEGTEDVSTFCGVFRCTEMEEYGGHYWQRLWHGCPRATQCESWGADMPKPDDCNEYTCEKPDDCDGDACLQYIVAVNKVGCSYNGECVMEDKSRQDDDTCRTETCTRYNGPRGPFGRMVVTKKKCPRDGSCYGKGETYTSGCDTYRCTGAGYFAPCQQGCSYKDQCIDEGDTNDDCCTVRVCALNETKEIFEMQIQKLRCKDAYGECHDIGDTWSCDSSCVKFTCVEKDGEAFVEECVTGCKGGDECTPLAGTVNKVNNTCIEYECTASGAFKLIRAECIDNYGMCFPNGHVWRPQKGCGVNKCVVDASDPSSVKTNIEFYPDCMIKNQCVLRGQKKWIDCVHYFCNQNGQPQVIEKQCRYGDKCIAVGQDPFVNENCKMVSCEVPLPGMDPVLQMEEYGCVYNGRCYAPDEEREEHTSCMRWRCNGDKHKFYKVVCLVGPNTCIEENALHWDEEDCVEERCVINSFPPGAELIEEMAGCVYKRKCYRKDDTAGSNCKIIQCKGNNDWVTIKEECETKSGDCKAVGDTWFDENACREFQCIAAPSGKGVKINVLYYGCESKAECIQHGDESSGYSKCMKYKCENGELKQIEVGCDLHGECLGAGQHYDDPQSCTRYICKIVSSRKGTISVELLEEPGCRDCSRVCYFIGDTKDMMCKTLVCRDPAVGLEVGQIHGCIDENGQCRAVGSQWDNEDTCMRRTCMPDGSIKDEPIGCIDSNAYDVCVRFGSPLNPGGQKCVSHTCKVANGKPYRDIQYTGCEYEDGCLAFGDSYPDEEECKTYKCIKKGGKPFLQESPYGCFSDIDGACYPFDHVETDPENDCVQYKCRRSQSFVVLKAECSYDGDCYRANKVWKDEDGDDCWKFTCKKENFDSGYRVRMVNDEERGCRYDEDDRCLYNGEKVKPGNCTEYVCDSDSGDLEIVELKCKSEYDGVCRDIGSEWYDRNMCSKFTCKRVSDSEVDIIEEEIGCKPDGKGKCYEDDEEVKRSCNVFECDGDTNNLMPTKMGCKVGGRCYDIDEEWTDRRTCITYTCMLEDSGPNKVITDVTQVQGCKYKNKCYMEGDEREDGCLTKVCEYGKWVTSYFRCESDDGCIEDGETFKAKDCTRYQCSSASQSLEPIEYGCNIKGTCYLAGKSWFNEKACKYYKCVYNPQTNNACPEIIKVGCLASGKCYGADNTQDDGCNQVACENGKLVVKQTGCEWKDGCKQVGETWEENCVFHKCVLKGRSPISVTTGIDVMHGCRSCSGCHRPNDLVQNGCVKQRCMKGGRLDTIEIKCTDPNTRSCVKEGDVVMVNGMKKECTPHGGYKIIPRPTYCDDGQGGRIPIGQTYENSDVCKLVKCVLQGYSTEWVTLEAGCSYDHKCYDIGKSWFDNKKCTKFMCVSKSDDKGVSSPEAIEQKGCVSKSTGLCWRVGQEWTEDCKSYSCYAASDRQDGKIKVDSEECISEATHTCYKEGAQWTESLKGQCYVFTCEFRIGGHYESKVVRPACRDHFGGCKEIGSTYYDCDVGGSLHHDCSCMSKDGKAYSSYNGSVSGGSYGISEYGSYGGAAYGEGSDYSSGGYGGAAYGGAAYGEGSDYSSGGYGGAADYGTGSSYGSSGGYGTSYDSNGGSYEPGATDYGTDSGNVGGYGTVDSYDTSSGYGTGSGSSGGYGGSYEPGATDYGTNSGNVGGYGTVDSYDTSSGYGTGSGSSGGYGGSYEPGATDYGTGSGTVGGYGAVDSYDSSSGYGTGSGSSGGSYEPVVTGYGTDSGNTGGYGSYDSSSGYGAGSDSYGSDSSAEDAYAPMDSYGSDTDGYDSYNSNGYGSDSENNDDSYINNDYGSDSDGYGTYNGNDYGSDNDDGYGSNSDGYDSYNGNDYGSDSESPYNGDGYGSNSDGYDSYNGNDYGSYSDSNDDSYNGNDYGSVGDSYVPSYGDDGNIYHDASYDNSVPSYDGYEAPSTDY